MQYAQESHLTLRQWSYGRSTLSICLRIEPFRTVRLCGSFLFDWFLVGQSGREARALDAALEPEAPPRFQDRSGVGRKAVVFQYVYFSIMIIYFCNPSRGSCVHVGTIVYVAAALL